MPIGGDLFRTLPRDGLRAVEEALGRGPIALGTEHRINQLPLFVNGSIPIHPAATHLYLGLILSAKSVVSESILRYVTQTDSDSTDSFRNDARGLSCLSEG